MASGKGGFLSLLIGAIVVVAVIMTCTEKCSSGGKEKEPSPNDIGFWTLGEFVDNFGDKTGRKYISQYFSGRFSKLGVQNQSANIEFIITGSDKVEIELYQYGRSRNDIMHHNDFTGTLQDSDGNRHTINARGGGRSTPRVTFNSRSSNVIHDALMKGGEVKIRLTEEPGGTQYSFDLSNSGTRGYSNAFKQMSGN